MTLMDAFLFLIALLWLRRIHVERKEDRRELIRQRTQLHKGGLL